ncbi:FecR family protein [Filimonas lacunae]|uniref:FecR family protein n=1 Tax=Filimonas lacunae TaxID=477680 RepID=A0A173MQG4_9BACT|nr:FecR family protein [Filimonas lacunae]BAV09690.1 anti-sigma factor [Filimonas lacunae]SIS77298.1 FecR family protein [Filimonas lacunae]
MNSPVHPTLEELLRRTKEGIADAEDYALLLKHIHTDATGEVLAAIDRFYAKEEVTSWQHVVPYHYDYWQQAFEEIKEASHLPDRKIPAIGHKVLWLQRRVWVAACLSLLLGAGAWLWYTSSGKKTPVSDRVSAAITPGKNGAILQLADGRQLVLDSMGNGVIAQQNGTVINLQNGVVGYERAGAASGNLTYNSIITPRGRQFTVVLPDGTRVWLNAASSITYPTAFAGKERKVMVTGEVYMEVAKQVGMPFKVVMGDKGEVEVLGTAFNINAYDNESMVRTTLVEGAVRVKADTACESIASVVLKPGQQAQVLQHYTTGNAVVNVEKADMEKTLAWKNGVFNLEDVSLKDAMREWERWYDIEVVYKDKIPDIYFTGKVNKDISFSGLLKLLEEAKVHYSMDGSRRLVIWP